MTVELRSATAADVPALQKVQRDAGQRFRKVGLDKVADDEPLPVAVLRRFAAAGRAWVAVDADDGVVGYVMVSIVDGAAHIDQVSVATAHQTRGIGRMLVDRARYWAGENALVAVTLTTFVDVPWNRPLYERLGFRVLGSGEVGPELAALMEIEASNGLDPTTRVAMVAGPLPEHSARPC